MIDVKKILLGLAVLGSLLFAEGPFTGKILQLQTKAVDPAYEIPLDKYPKWLCEATLKNGKKAQFISVKAMMQVYFHQEHFKKYKLLEDDIQTMYVQDFISGQKVEATKAVYLFGSRITGPHGDDLIPFSSEENAKLFMMKNGGTKILPYARITKGLIRYLDM
jgi:nitrous oxide reductase accessory protein NosL